MTSERLPVDALLPEIKEALDSGNRLVLRAATGAGKTTRVPPALLREGGQIVVLEPRRVAARAAAARVAGELDVELGREVGYQVRFDNRTSKDTQLSYVTEGIFLRRLQSDPFLDGVHTVVIDEFHERSLIGDTVLALVRLLQDNLRGDLRLLIMSATLELEDLGDRLGAPVIDSPGRSYPVEIDYLKRPDPRPVPSRVAAAVRRIVGSERAGATGLDSVLAFLPGRGELTRTAEQLDDLGVPIEQLYGDLPLEQQTRVLRSTQRRVVLATNVAETSVTVDGIGFVVDSGMHRELRFDPATGLDRLELLPISRAAADQRAGRAGRQGPGHALRLWTSSEQAQRLPASKPEIERVDLSSTILFVLAMGEQVDQLPWLDPPPPASLQRARQLLHDLGAVDSAGITDLGRRLADLPVHPRLGRILLDGAAGAFATEAALLAALLSERDPITSAQGPTRGQGRSVDHPTDSDLFDRLAILQGARTGAGSGRVHRGRVRNIQRMARQLAGMVPTDTDRRPDFPRSGEANSKRLLLGCLLDAYPDRVAALEALEGESHEVTGRMVGDIGVRLSPRSNVALPPGARSLALCTELGGVFQSGDRRRTVVHSATLLDLDDLPPERLVEEDIVAFDESSERVVGYRVASYRVGAADQPRRLELDRRDAIPHPERAAELLAERAKLELERALGLDRDRFRSLRRRLAFVHLEIERAPIRSAESLPVWTAATWSEVIDHLASGCRSYAELQQAAAKWIPHLLDHRQRSILDRLAPERIELPNGRSAAVEYPEDGPPTLAARIQDLFGWQDTPRILDGRYPLLLQLLAPNMRPQQITDDLRGFWTGSYELVRKELAGRYPKHPWPTNPLEASPTPRRRPGRRRN